MSWRKLAFANMRHNARQYAGYLLSCGVAVMIVFMFASFVQNPRVAAGHMPTPARAILNGCEFLVIGFSLFFILFFHAALLRRRGKEFGLFLVLGMMPAQVGRLVFVESLWLALAALITGGLGGLLLLKLFLLALAALLSLPGIPFVVPQGALIETAVLFALIFLLDAIVSSVRVARRTPRAVMLSARVRQTPPRASVLLVIIGVGLLAAGYALALLASNAVVVTMIPIVVLTGFGTYLLFGQVSVLALERLRASRFDGPTRLSAARLAHRVKDNARVLTAVTLLSAMVMTGMGALSGLEFTLRQNTVHVDPFGVQWATAGSVNAAQRQAGSLRRILQRHHVSVTERAITPFLIGDITETGKGNSRAATAVRIIPASAYDALREVIIRSHAQLRADITALRPPATGHATLLVSYPDVLPTLFPDHRAILSVGGARRPLVIDSQQSSRVWNEQSGIDFGLVVPDAQFRSWSARAPLSLRGGLTGFMLSDWQHSMAGVAALRRALPAQERQTVTATVHGLAQSDQLFSVTLFAGFFVSLLFLFACASTLYLRLMSQEEDDKKQFQSLWRIGLDERRARRVVAGETAFLFFAPLALALLHSTVAMLDFSHLVPLAPSGWVGIASVAAAYALCLVLYYLLAVRGHAKRVIMQ